VSATPPSSSNQSTLFRNTRIFDEPPTGEPVEKLAVFKSKQELEKRIHDKYMDEILGDDGIPTDLPF
jgi:hypothetical protein